MTRRFEAWVRLFTGGVFAIAAGLSYLDWTSGRRADGRILAVAFGVAAVGFSAATERIAFLFRHRWLYPSWWSPLARTHIDTDRWGEPLEYYSSYRPQLKHLAWAFTAATFYLLFEWVDWPRTQTDAALWAILLVAMTGLDYAAWREARRCPPSDGSADPEQAEP